MNLRGPCLKDVGRLSFSILAVLLFSVLAAHPAVAVTPPPSPFTQCPPVGADPTGCELLIVINSNGSTSIYASTTDTGPFDSADDTTIGVQDNCSPTVCASVTSMTVSGTGLAGFDADEACSGIFSPNPPVSDCIGGVYTASSYPNPLDGETTSIGITVTNLNSVVLTFTPPLTASSSAWLSLETAATTSSITISPPVIGPKVFLSLTTTSVVCITTPLTTVVTSVCTATVAPASWALKSPSGIVAFSQYKGPGQVTFKSLPYDIPVADYVTCVLSPISFTHDSSCSVPVTGVIGGNVTIWAQYSGDKTYYSSKDIFTVLVTDPPSASPAVHAVLNSSGMQVPSNLWRWSASKFDFLSPV